MSVFRISLLQVGLVWENPVANLDYIEKKIKGLNGRSDAVLLPEMFSTGFTMNSSQWAQTMDGTSVDWMKRISAETGMALGGSLIIKDLAGTFNRFVWATPEGKLSYYDKRHLFFLERDSGAYASGKRRVVVEYKGLRILLAICYDLRFPVWLRNRNDYDAIFIVANWPSARRQVWIKLLMARAIENQCYVCAVNRIGSDENGITYTGDTMVCDMKGEIMRAAENENEEIITAELDTDALFAFREKFPVWRDADDFEIKF
ncbi:MAG TPA: amidohydrolase [Bacteroidales bacterium]|nr:amidohydrolase [Bacteroidales bacterium]